VAKQHRLTDGQGVGLARSLNAQALALLDLRTRCDLLEGRVLALETLEGMVSLDEFTAFTEKAAPKSGPPACVPAGEV